MTTFVTVNTSASTSVLVPFTSAANAALAQAALDAGPNSAASIGGGFFKYFSPSVGGAVTPPGVLFLGGIAQTIPNAVAYGLLPGTYQDLVNAGSGTALAVGAANTSIWSGQNATTVFLNANAQGQAFLGGGKDVVSNAFSFASMNVIMDSPNSTVLGGSTLIMSDTIGGASTVQAQANDLILVQGGGSDLVVANSGTVVVETARGTGSAQSATTIQAVAGATLWAGVIDGKTFINPGAGNTFVFGANPAGESSATLFGGALPGTSIVGAAFTGRATVGGVNGYLQGGSAGTNLLASGTTDGAATLVAGGAGDVIFLNAQGDIAKLGNNAGVIAVTATSVPGNTGNTFFLGSGDGEALGGARGHNTFVFQGAGTYTVAGFHDTDLTGSIYKDAATAAGGAGNITIVDFFPQQIQTVTVAASLGGGTATIGTAQFDKFDTGGKSVSSLVSTPLGGGIFNNVAHLSDGTTINFTNTIGPVHQAGTFIV